MKDYYTAIMVYHLNFLGNPFQWFCFYSYTDSYYTYLLGYFWVAQTKNHSYLRSPYWESAGSDNRHYLFNILKNDKRKRQGRVFNTQYILHFWANLKNDIMEATIPECSIKSTVKQVWFILQIYLIIVRWHKCEPCTNYPKKKWYAMGTSSFPKNL